VGANTVTINYSGDGNNNPASASPTLTVTKVPPTITVTPSSPSITAADSLGVLIALNGPAGQAWPTGSITLTNGSYASGATTLVNGSANVTIPAGALVVGADTLTATYTGDNYYSTGSATGTVNVSTVPPSVKIDATSVTISSPGATTGNTATITITPAGGFTGSVNLTAAVTSSPSGAQNPPTVSFGSTTPVSISGPAAVTAALTVTTTPTTTSALAPLVPAHRNWYAAGEIALGLLVLFGMPARRRRNWRAWVGMLLLLSGACIGIAACGGGGGSTPTPTPVTHQGTTAGIYVVTVTATSGSLTANTTLNLTVQ
jgi:hypothetical protein